MTSNGAGVEVVRQTSGAVSLGPDRVSWASLIRTVQPPWLPLRTSALGAALVRVVRKASAMKEKDAVTASSRALRRSASVACAEAWRSASAWRASAARPPESGAAGICPSRASRAPAFAGIARFDHVMS